MRTSATAENSEVQLWHSHPQSYTFPVWNCAIKIGQPRSSNIVMRKWLCAGVSSISPYLSTRLPQLPSIESILGQRVLLKLPFPAVLFITSIFSNLVKQPLAPRNGMLHRLLPSMKSDNAIRTPVWLEDMKSKLPNGGVALTLRFYVRNGRKWQLKRGSRGGGSYILRGSVLSGNRNLGVNLMKTNHSIFIVTARTNNPQMPPFRTNCLPLLPIHQISLLF